MTEDVNKLKKYLLELGARDVSHSSDDFLTHLVGVYDYLKRRQYPEHISYAGLFHSIYGTDAFKDLSLALTNRDEIRQLIGERAEQLVYLYCAVSHRSLLESLKNNSRNGLQNRFVDRPLEITDQEYEELLLLVWVNCFEIETRTSDKLSKPAALLRKWRHQITKLLSDAGLIHDIHFQLKTAIAGKIIIARSRTD